MPYGGIGISLLVPALARMLTCERAISVRGTLQCLGVDPVGYLVFTSPLVYVGKPNAGDGDQGRIISGVPQTQPTRDQGTVQISEQAKQDALLAVQATSFCPVIVSGRVQGLLHGIEDQPERLRVFDDLPKGDRVGVQSEVLEPGMRSHGGIVGGLRSQPKDAATRSRLSDLEVRRWTTVQLDRPRHFTYWQAPELTEVLNLNTVGTAQLASRSRS